MKRRAILAQAVGHKNRGDESNGAARLRLIFWLKLTKIPVDIKYQYKLIYETRVL
jgi:hypothetical protein